MVPGSVSEDDSSELVDEGIATLLSEGVEVEVAVTDWAAVQLASSR